MVNQSHPNNHSIQSGDSSHLSDEANSSEAPRAPSSTTLQLIELLAPVVQPIGYEVVHLEVIPAQRLLRVFIDHQENSAPVGIEDCVKVTKALDEPLEQIPQITSIFGEAGYELEVSSPGIDRPLRTERDFEKFKSHEIRVHTFRPLTGEELGNSDYATKNPKQKNFLGTIQGFNEGRVTLVLNLTGGHDPTQKKSGKKAKGAAKKTQALEANTNSAEVVVNIPLPLISKANLEPALLLMQDGIVR